MHADRLRKSGASLMSEQEQAPERISLGRQINAVEIAFQMIHEWYDNAIAKAAKGIAWPEEDLEQKRRRMRELQAAVNTLTWLENNREAVVTAHRNTKA
jgi:flagellar biosynthesis chaperone FliJ